MNYGEVQAAYRKVGQSWKRNVRFVVVIKEPPNGLRYPRRACNLSKNGGRGAASGARFVSRRYWLANILCEQCAQIHWDAPRLRISTLRG